MRKNEKNCATKNEISARAFARAERRNEVAAAGAFGQRWLLRDINVAESLPPKKIEGVIFNPLAARAGEIRACVRMTQALLREGETVHVPAVKQARKPRVEEGEDPDSGWRYCTEGEVRGTTFVGTLHKIVSFIN